MLHSFEIITHCPLEWDRGVHGLRFVGKDGKARGTYLPYVPLEEGWDKELTLQNLIACKAGMNDQQWRPVLAATTSADGSGGGGAMLQRYQTMEVVCSYADYLANRGELLK